MAVKPNKILLSTTSFWFWLNPFDPRKAVEFALKSKADIDGLDIFVFTFHGGGVSCIGDDLCYQIENFDFNVIHTTFHDIDWAGKVDFKDFVKRIKALAKLLNQSGIENVSIHSDCFFCWPERVAGIIDEYLNGYKISLELMDKNKSFGNTVGDYKKIVELLPWAYLVPDLAHLSDYEGEERVAVFEDADLLDRISYVHMSCHSSQIKDQTHLKTVYSLIPEHLPCVIAEEGLAYDLLPHATQYPVALEGALPFGEFGWEILEREIFWWRQMCGMLS
jgi:hypothetical protein